MYMHTEMVRSKLSIISVELVVCSHDNLSVM